MKHGKTLVSWPYCRGTVNNVWWFRTFASREPYERTTAERLLTCLNVDVTVIETGGVRQAVDRWWWNDCGEDRDGRWM